MNYPKTTQPDKLDDDTRLEAALVIKGQLGRSGLAEGIGQLGPKVRTLCHASFLITFLFHFRTVVGCTYP